MTYTFPKDLLTGASTAPGRVRSYIEQQRSGINKGLLPQSCLLTVHEDLYTTMFYASQDLRSGAGEKLILDNFQKSDPLEFEWYFTMNINHLDFDKITEEQKKYFMHPQETQNYPYDHYIWVHDSMEESADYKPSIEASWEEFINAAKKGQKIIVDLSLLRPSGSANDKGLVATGPVGDGSEESNESSFLAVYIALAKHLQTGDITTFLQLMGTLNATLRRGGIYKNGIITSSMIYINPSIFDYLNVDLTQVPGSHKMGVRVDEGVLNNQALVDLIVDKANTVSLFLEKIDPTGTYMNVCEAIQLHHRGTCLIWRVNLAQCAEPRDLPSAFESAMESLCHLHISWRKDNPEKSGIYRHLEEDRQVGLDVLGLANALRQWGVTYRDFVEALRAYLYGTEFGGSDMAAQIVTWLHYAYIQASRKADQIMDENNLPRLERLFTVEPSQSHAYECKDLDGYTTARSIFAPFNNRIIRRSNSQKNKKYNHGPVEIAPQVGPELHQDLCEAWQLLMDTTGRAHAISFDSWNETTDGWFTDWLLCSPLKSRYYQFVHDYNQSYLQKVANEAVNEEVATQCSLENKGACSVCAE